MTSAETHRRTTLESLKNSDEAARVAGGQRGSVLKEKVAEAIWIQIPYSLVGPYSEIRSE